MTGHDDFDRTLAGWFKADAMSPAPAGDLDRVLDLTRGRRPRPAWLAGPGSQWVGGAPDAVSGAGVRSLGRLELRWSRTVLLLLVIAVLVGGAIVVGATLFQPSLLPAGRLGHLAYGLDGDIYVADWDGGNPVRIADGHPGGGPAGCGSYWGEGPMWSPDGRYLAYRSAWEDSCRGTTGVGKVYISDPAGHVVASFPGTGWLVSWSPDSTRVATWVALDQTIGIYGVDGVRQALIALPPGLGPPGDYDPVWSPDGRSVLMRLDSSSPSVVWELPIDGGAPLLVPEEEPRSHWDAAFSGDGTRVAFNEDGYLVVAANDGTQRRLLAEVGIPQPPGSIVWSPTDDRVAFTWSVDGSMSNLRVMDVATGDVWELASAREIGLVRFSPEGDRILVVQADHNNVSSLWSVNADVSDAQVPFFSQTSSFDAQRLVRGADWGDWQWQPADR
jgi:Tol biopolymer transport system component